MNVSLRQDALIHSIPVITGPATCQAQTEETHAALLFIFWWAMPSYLALLIHVPSAIFFLFSDKAFFYLFSISAFIRCHDVTIMSMTPCQAFRGNFIIKLKYGLPTFIVASCDLFMCKKFMVDSTTLKMCVSKYLQCCRFNSDMLSGWLMGAFLCLACIWAGKSDFALS